MANSTHSAKLNIQTVSQNQLEVICSKHRCAPKKEGQTVPKIELTPKRGSERPALKTKHLAFDKGAEKKARYLATY